MNKAMFLVAVAIAVSPLVSSVIGSEAQPREAGTSEKASSGRAAALEALAATIDAADAGRRTAVNIAWSDSDAREKAANFLGSQVAHHDAIQSLQQCRSCHSGSAAAAWLLDHTAVSTFQPKGPWIGVSVAPADGVLRSQLRLPDGTGVVVTQVVPNGPAQQAGVEADDVLLSVNGKPIAAGEDLDRVLQSTTPDGPPVELKLVHEGATVEKQVKPRGADAQTFLDAFLAEGRPTYRIGVNISEPDQTLRRQLKLGDAGLVVNEVTASSPAEGAGIKAADVLVSVNGNRLVKQQDLTDAVVRAAESPVELELVRGGVTLKISVTPAKEAADAGIGAYLSFVAREPRQVRELMLVHPTAAKAFAAEEAARWTHHLDAARGATQPAAERLRMITEQLDQLRGAVDALRGELEQAGKDKDGK